MTIIASFLLVTGLAVSVRAQTDSVQVLVNRWGLGIDEQPGCPYGDIESGWVHLTTVTEQGESRVSASGCYKNPTPPDGDYSGGAAFKIGPYSSGGTSYPFTPVQSYQEFNLQERGVPLADSYEFRLDNILIACLGCNYLYADLQGFNGTDWLDLGRLAEIYPYPNGDTPPDGWPFLCQDVGSIWWYRYCPQGLLTVPHYEQYRFWVTVEWSSRSGIKWTGPKLLVTALEDTPPIPTPTNTVTTIPTDSPTATPTPTDTPEPTATAEPTETNTPTPTPTPVPPTATPTPEPPTASPTGGYSIFLPVIIL